MTLSPAFLDEIRARTLLSAPGNTGATRGLEIVENDQ